jgi:RNA polymerase sigma factor (TIGR02999 family)
MSDVSQMLDAVRAGRAAPAELLTLVYDELRRLAAAKLAHEPPGQTLQPTALVHEAFLRVGADQTFDGRGHFFAACAEAIRRVLVDRARAKRADKRGGALRRHDVHELPVAAPQPDDDLLALHEALDRFAELEPQKAELVKLRYFVGLTIDEAAEALGISPATAKRHWAYSKAWLFAAVRGEKKSDNS